MGKYCHFLIDILGQICTMRDRKIAHGVRWAIVIEAGPISSATEMDQLRSFPNSEKKYNQRNNFLNFASFSQNFYTDFLFYLTTIFCHFSALFRRACEQSADRATLMS